MLQKKFNRYPVYSKRKLKMVNSNAFDAFAKRAQEDTDRRNNRSSYSSNDNNDYEKIKWVGLKPNAWSIVRLVGNPPEALTPGFKAQPTDAAEIFVSDIKDDNGKRMQLRLPIPGDLADKDHVMWKIIRKVMETTYVDKKRVYKYEQDANAKDVFNIVAHGGWDPAKDYNQFKFSKGWQGQRVCIVNVIDRSDMAWHKENKMTKLLSRNVSESVTESGETKYWPAIGVPSFGFVNNVGGIVSNYGDWNNYDIGIKRTGQMTNPYSIVNASAFKLGGLKEIPDDMLAFVSTEPLTDEEKSWKRVEIGKLYAPTSYTKLKNSLGRTIKAIDNVFGTKYYDDIAEGAAKEEEARKAAAVETANAKQEEAETDNSDLDQVFGVSPTQPEPTPVRESAPVRQSAETAASIATTEKLSPEKLGVLKGYQYLTDEQKNQIADVELDSDGKITNIKYNTDEQVVACPHCAIPGLMAHTHCLACGIKFD